MSIKKLVFTIFYLLFTIFLYAQNNNSDSIALLLNSTKLHDTTRINLMKDLSKSYQINKLDTSILILENTVRFCNKVSNNYSNEVLYTIQKKKSNCLYALGEYYRLNGDSSNQFFYLRKCQDLRTTLKDTVGLVDVLIAKGLFYSEHGNYKKALQYFDKSLKISKKGNYKKGIAETYNDIGYVENNNGQIEKALQTYFSGLLIQEEIKDFKGASSTLNNIAFIYYQQDNFDKALEYWLKSLEYRIQIKNKRLISHSLLNLGSVYYQQGNPDKALEYFKKSYEIQLELGDQLAGAYSLNNIGFIYKTQKDYINARKYWEECLSIRRSINDKKGTVYSLQNMSSLFIDINEYNTALKYAKEAVELSNELDIVSLQKQSYHRLYLANFKLKKYKEALYNFKKYTLIKDSLLNDRNTKALAEQDAKFKYNIKQIADSISYSDELKIKDLNISKQKAIVQKQKQQKYALSIGIVLILVILGLGYRMLKSKQKANALLYKQKSEIEEQATILYTQNEEIQAQRDEIEYQKQNLEEVHLNVKDSIAYAKNIQNAMLPNINDLKHRFSDSFVFFKPKDVVSGDFYWWTEVENTTVITAADCTGHGVPGAFMSMLGVSFLREIVNKEYITHTGVILRKLRKEVIKALKQKTNADSLTMRDGMDMALISINNDTKILQYSGANNPLYIVKNSKIETENPSVKEFTNTLDSNISINKKYFYEIKPNKMPIAMYDKMDRFSTHEVQLEKGDIVYLFSDGYVDQFGGPKGKKFKTRAFKNLLAKNCEKTMVEQREILFSTFESWRANNEQVDDLVVLGIKI